MDWMLKVIPGYIANRASLSYMTPKERHRETVKENTTQLRDSGGDSINTHIYSFSKCLPNISALRVCWGKQIQLGKVGDTYDRMEYCAWVI